MMRTEAPKDLEGRGVVNFARTTPELPVYYSLARSVPPICRHGHHNCSLPCGLVTLPQMTRILVPRTSF